MLAADLVWPLRDAPSGAFALEDANAAPEQAVVTAVDRPVLLGYAPTSPMAAPCSSWAAAAMSR